MRRLALAALLLGALFPDTALAKGDGGKVEFERGLRFYQAQEYDAALPYFQKAYEHSGKRPSTIRALAQCERSLKLYEDAIKHFKEYLASKPSDAKEVEETLDLLNELVAEHAKNEAPPKTEPPPSKVAPTVAPPVAPPPKAAPPPKVAPPPVAPPPAPPPPGPALTHTAPPPEEPSIVESPWLWVGVGAAVVVGGGVALALALSGGEDDPYQGTSGVILSGP